MYLDEFLVKIFIFNIQFLQLNLHLELLREIPLS